MTTYFYSDPHFGHANVIEYSKRPFASVEEMDEHLIEKYQSHVEEKDTVIWCGDCFFGPPERAREIMRQLPGTKILVRGNHDGTNSRMLASGFSMVVERMLVRVADVVAEVSHYPFAGTEANRLRSDGTLDERYLDRRPTPKPGQVLIHGHTHSKVRRVNNQIHVGVDAWEYGPVSKTDVASLVMEWLASRAPGSVVERG